MSGIFQGYTNSDGRVRVSEVTKVPAGGANDRGMVVAGNRVIPYLADGGQPRVLHDGIAFDEVTGLMLATVTPFGATNISMGGLLVDSRGAVVLENAAPQVIHQGVGLQNDGKLSIEAEPIATFIAPLRNGIASTTGPGDFERASDAWYKDGSGVYRNVGINQPRFEQNRLLMEPAQTNKCENYNANPDPELTNVTPGAATASLVAAPAELLALGLSDICSDGNVIELHNQGGGPTNAGITGSVGNLNAHVVSAWMNTFGSVVEFGVSDNRQLVSTVGWERVTVIATPTGTWNTWQVRLDPGERVQFILNQLEESPVVTSPIVTEGTAGQRAAETLTYTPVSGYFRAFEGMALCTISFPFDFAANFLQYNAGLVSQRGIAPAVLYLRNDAGVLTLRSYHDGGQGTYIGPEFSFSAGDVIACANRWYNGNRQELGISINGAPWLWATIYQNALTWTDDGNGEVNICLDVREAREIQNVQLYNEDKGRAWIEENYP